MKSRSALSAEAVGQGLGDGTYRDSWKHRLKSIRSPGVDHHFTVASGKTLFQQRHTLGSQVGQIGQVVAVMTAP